MSYLNSLSANFTKLVSSIFIIALAAGCASVTDATTEQLPEEEPKLEQVAPPQPDRDIFSGDDMDTSVDEPDMEKR
jgi:hypothetical protein